MARQFGYGAATIVPAYAAATAFGALSVSATLTELLVAGTAAAALAVTIATFAFAHQTRRKRIYLIIDEAGLRSPVKDVTIAWDNLVRVRLCRPPKGRGGLPALAFDLHDPAQAGPGGYTPKYLRSTVSAFGAPLVYLDLPRLDAPLAKVLAEVERYAPGKLENAT